MSRRINDETTICKEIFSYDQNRQMVMIVCRMVFLALVVREFVQKLHTFFYKTCYSGAGIQLAS